jgi:hypothetical protein
MTVRLVVVPDVFLPDGTVQRGQLPCGGGGEYAPEPFFDSVLFLLMPGDYILPRSYSYLDFYSLMHQPNTTISGL